MCSAVWNKRGVAPRTRRRVPLTGRLSPRLPSCLFIRDTLGDVDPALESDANIVPISPEQSTLSNREKVIERDEEAYGKEAQPIGMYYGVRLADIVSHNAQFSATIKEQQALCRMLDHRQSNPYVAALAVVLEEARDAAPKISLRNCPGNLEPDSELNGQFQ